MKPTKILEETRPTIARAIDEEEKISAERVSKWGAPSWWISATPLYVMSYPFIKAADWYKRLYNAWADLTNRAKLELIDRQIRNFQENNPNKISQPIWKRNEYKSPADKVKEAWATTDSEVLEATHQFWYWNDPRTVYRRLRYRKQQVNPKPRISL